MKSEYMQGYDNGYSDGLKAAAEKAKAARVEAPIPMNQTVAQAIIYALNTRRFGERTTPQTELTIQDAMASMRPLFLEDGHAAGRIHGVDPTSTGKEPKERQIGKVPELACGYQEGGLTIQQIVAAALFDLMGYLTCRDERVTLSGRDDASPAVQALEAWAKARAFNLDDPAIHGWRDHIHRFVGAPVAPPVAQEARAIGKIMIAQSGHPFASLETAYDENGDGWKHGTRIYAAPVAPPVAQEAVEPEMYQIRRKRRFNGQSDNWRSVSKEDWFQVRREVEGDGAECWEFRLLYAAPVASRGGCRDEG